MKSGTIYGLLSGMLTVQADGPFTERLLNICMHRNLLVKDVKRCGNNRVIFKTDIASFMQMHTPAHRTKSRIRIKKRSGLPFLIKRFRKRLPVLVGIIAIGIVLGYASTHIMGITVFGNSRIDTQTIYNSLSECGLSLGAKTSDIDNDLIRNKMMNKLDDLAWIGINANGSRVYVEIIERIEKENGLEKDGAACNLIASRDGVIDHTEIREGQTLIKKGSGVCKGDVLVSGIIDSPVDGFRFVKARGEVYAKTVYTKKREYKLNYIESHYTGKSKARYSVKVLNTELPVYLNGKPPYQKFSVNESINEYRIPIDIVPSLFIRKNIYNEYYDEEKSRTASEAIETGINELTQEIKSELPEGAEIKEQNESHTLTEHGGVEVTVELTCLENIAEQYVIESPLSPED